MTKNAPFHIKLPVKNFHGPAKWGGHRTVALPLNTPLIKTSVLLIFPHYYTTVKLNTAMLSLHKYCYNYTRYTMNVS